jgi:hypothetical protein
MRRGRYAAPVRALGSITVVVAVLASAGSAAAYDATLDTTATAQAYQLRGPTGDPLISRRRTTETLALSVDHLGDESRSDAPQVFFRARLRVDADFGIDASEAYFDRTNPESRFVPGLAVAPVDLMYGYLEGRRFAHGALGFRLGRQYVIDPLGYYAFDGGWVRVNVPAYFAVEAYGGFEVRAGLPLSGVSNTAPGGELGGVLRGDRTGIPFGAYPSFEQAGLAPVIATAIESAGPHWLKSRLTYRRAWNTGAAYVAGATGATLDALGLYDRPRVSSERVGYALSAQPFEALGVHGDLVFDLVYQRFSTVDVGIESSLDPKVKVSADWSYWQPTFDADSIFNVFGFEPTNDLSARVEWDPLERLTLSGDARLRIYRSDDPAAAPTTSAPGTANVGAIRVADSLAPGGDLRARWKLDRGRIAARASAIVGDQGHRVGGDASFERKFGLRWSTEARVSLYEFEDRLRADPGDPNAHRHALSLGYVLGGAYVLSPWSTASVQWEHDMNRLVGQRFRVLAAISVRLGL